MVDVSADQLLLSETRFHSNGCWCVTCADRCSLPWNWTVELFCVSLHRWTDRWCSGLIHSQSLICLNLRVKDKFSLVSSANSHFKESSMTVWALYHIYVSTAVFAVVLKSAETIKVLVSARDTAVFMLLLQSYFCSKMKLLKWNTTAVFDWDSLVNLLHQTECSYLACGYC